MKSFLQSFFRKNVYLILTAIILFASAYVVNYFLRSNASTKLLKNSIESFLQSRESDFVRLSAKTGYLDRLVREDYSLSDLEELQDIKYGLFLFREDSAGRLSSNSGVTSAPSFPTACSAVATGTILSISATASMNSSR